MQMDITMKEQAAFVGVRVISTTHLPNDGQAVFFTGQLPQKAADEAFEDWLKKINTGNVVIVRKANP